MYKCCFFACFCASQRVQRRKDELTLALIREKLHNGWADWHQSWHTCAHSYGNGHTTNKLPLETQAGYLGGGGGGLGGQQFKSLGKLSDWYQLWFTSADSSGNGHRLNTSRPSIPQVVFRGRGGGQGFTNSKVLGSCQTAGPICPKFGTRLQIHLGMDIRQTHCPSRHKRATWWGGGRGQIFKSLGSCQTAGPIGPNFGLRLRISLGMDTG